MNNKSRFTESEARQLLNEAVRKAGSQAEFADSNDISRQHLGDVLNGRRDLAGIVLEALGLERVVLFQPVKRTKPRKR